MALMCNPLIGHISAMYSLKTNLASFGSQFEFNAYSYESDLSVGCELWRSEKPGELAVFRTIKTSGSLARRSLNILWEGRFKELLVSAGVGFSFASRIPECSTIGVSFQYSS